MSETNAFLPQGYDNTNHFWDEGEEVTPEIDENEYHMNPQGYDNTGHFWGGGETEIAATIEVDSVQTFTLDPDRDAEAGVRNIGTEQEAKLAFTFGIPKGRDGNPGTNGVSPTVTVTDITGGHRITITDATDTKSFDVIDGTNGVTPVISASASIDNQIGTPEVTVTKTGTDEAPSFAFAFKNLKGGHGDDGVSPTVTVTDITGGHRVTITDAIDTQSFDVMDGTDGVTPVISATATVGTNVGTPSCTVTKTGTDAAPSFAFAFDCIKGADGQGIPTGGTAGQVLQKVSAADYDVQWGNVSSGGGSDFNGHYNVCQNSYSFEPASSASNSGTITIPYTDLYVDNFAEFLELYAGFNVLFVGTYIRGIPKYGKLYRLDKDLGRNDNSRIIERDNFSFIYQYNYSVYGEVKINVDLTSAGIRVHWYYYNLPGTGTANGTISVSVDGYNRRGS